MAKYLKPRKSKRKPLITHDDARTQVALKLARDGLARLRWKRDWSGMVFDRKGRQCVNPLRQVPRAVRDALDVIMKNMTTAGDDYIINTNVDPSQLWSFQTSLRRRSLVKYIRNYRDVSKRPRNCHYPLALRACGKLVLWNGNHRAVGALLRGEKVPRINVLDVNKYMAKARREARMYPKKGRVLIR